MSVVPALKKGDRVASAYAGRNDILLKVPVTGVLESTPTGRFTFIRLDAHSRCVHGADSALVPVKRLTRNDSIVAKIKTAKAAGYTIKSRIYNRDTTEEFRGYGFRDPRGNDENRPPHKTTEAAWLAAFKDMECK